MASGELATWEYRVSNHMSERELNTLGAEGWDLVGVTDGQVFLKRPRLDFRERVTLDQKRRYYAQWGTEHGEGDDR